MQKESGVILCGGFRLTLKFPSLARNYTGGSTLFGHQKLLRLEVASLADARLESSAGHERRHTPLSSPRPYPHPYLIRAHTYPTAGHVC